MTTDFKGSIEDDLPSQVASALNTPRRSSSMSIITQQMKRPLASGFSSLRPNQRPDSTQMKRGSTTSEIASKDNVTMDSVESTQWTITSIPTSELPTNIQEHRNSKGSLKTETMKADGRKTSEAGIAVASSIIADSRKRTQSEPPKGLAKKVRAMSLIFCYQQ